MQYRMSFRVRDAATADLIAGLIKDSVVDKIILVPVEDEPAPKLKAEPTKRKKKRTRNTTEKHAMQHVLALFHHEGPRLHLEFIRNDLSRKGYKPGTANACLSSLMALDFITRPDLNVPAYELVTKGA